MRMGSWTPASARWVNREWRSWCRVRGSQRRCGPTGVLNSAHRHGEPDDKGEKRHRGRRQQRARRRPPAAHRRHRQRYHADRGHHRGVEVYERGRPEPGKGEDHAPPPDTPAAEAPCRRPQDRRRPRVRQAAAGGWRRSGGTRRTPPPEPPPTVVAIRAANRTKDRPLARNASRLVRLETGNSNEAVLARWLQA